MKKVAQILIIQAFQESEKAKSLKASKVQLTFISEIFSLITPATHISVLFSTYQRDLQTCLGLVFRGPPKPDSGCSNNNKIFALIIRNRIRKSQ